MKHLYFSNAFKAERKRKGVYSTSKWGRNDGSGPLFGRSSSENDSKSGSYVDDDCHGVDDNWFLHNRGSLFSKISRSYLMTSLIRIISCFLLCGVVCLVQHWYFTSKYNFQVPSSLDIPKINGDKSNRMKLDHFYEGGTMLKELNHVESEKEDEDMSTVDESYMRRFTKLYTPIPRLQDEILLYCHHEDEINKIKSAIHSIYENVKFFYDRSVNNGSHNENTDKFPSLHDPSTLIRNGMSNFDFSLPQITWDWITIVKLISSLLLVCLSALFSGLTLGLMGLDKNSLAILSKSGSPSQKRYAKIIIPVRNRGNLLLCTLLLGNVMVNAALSILSADLTSGIYGFLISTTLITIFGEIIPQAICSRHALVIGAYTVWLVYIFMAVLFVVAFPISCVLDCILGQEISTIYSKDELRKLIDIHGQHTKVSGLEQHELMILGGALEFSGQIVGNIMTPISNTFMLDVHDKLNADTMTLIWEAGHSRIPIYKDTKQNIIGFLFAKDLVLVDPDEQLPIGTVLAFYGREVIKVFSDTHLDEVLKTFKTGKSHIAVVHEVVEPETGGDPYYQTLGIVTLEDVIEEILKDEIQDETDIQPNLRADVSGISILGKQRRLSPQQVTAISSYLLRSIDLFKSIPEELVYKIIGQSRVFNIEQGENVSKQLNDYYIKLFFPFPTKQKVNVVDGNDLIAEKDLERRGGSLDLGAHHLDIQGMRFSVDYGVLGSSSEERKKHPEEKNIPGQSEDDQKIYLYKRSIQSSFFILILHGKVEVSSGIDNFTTECGQWSYFGVRALSEPKFIPDFDAKFTQSSKILKIGQREFIQQLTNYAHHHPEFELPKDLKWMEKTNQWYQMAKQKNNTTKTKHLELRDINLKDNHFSLPPNLTSGTQQE